MVNANLQSGLEFSLFCAALLSFLSLAFFFFSLHALCGFDLHDPSVEAASLIPLVHFRTKPELYLSKPAESYCPLPSKPQNTGAHILQGQKIGDAKLCSLQAHSMLTE